MLFYLYNVVSFLTSLFFWQAAMDTLQDIRHQCYAIQEMLLPAPPENATVRDEDSVNNFKED